MLLPRKHPKQSGSRGLAAIRASQGHRCGNWARSSGSSCDHCRTRCGLVCASEHTRRAEPGRAIDHLGWRAPEIDAKIAELKQKSVQVTGEPSDVRDLRVAFAEDPSISSGIAGPTLSIHSTLLRSCESFLKPRVMAN